MVKIGDLTKLYYPIGEVAKMFEVNTSLIRFWEKEFPTIKPKKNKKGNRLFSPDAIAEIQKVYQLVKIEGHTLEGARKSLKTSNKSDALSLSKGEKLDVIDKLEEIKEKLIRLKGSE